MSRSHDAKRKAARRTAKAASAETEAEKKWRGPRLPGILATAFVIVSLAGIALFLYAGAGTGKSDAQARHRVATLLAGVPQKGTVLGSPRAPWTIVVFADLECPTVKAFAETYLPSLIQIWVRPGVLRIEYQPLRTDTIDDEAFYRQEVATLAAGRQNRLWNYALTFLYEQQPHYSDYVTDRFLSDIAAQVPDLKLAAWRQARPDPRLMADVIDSVYFAHTHSTRFTPSFFIGPTPGGAPGPPVVSAGGGVRRKIELRIRQIATALEEEVGRDNPTVRAFDSSGLGG